MSEDDDRAAKAARAKALLDKRRRKKVAGSGALASPPPSRSFTPVLQESAPSTENTKNDVADLFTPADSDTNWIESLPRADVPHSTASNVPSTNAPTSSILSGQAEMSLSQVTSLQTTVASLQSENSSLRSSLSRSEALGTDTKAQLKKLEEENSTLKLQLHQEQQRAQDTSRRVEVVVQEKQSLEDAHRSSQAEILQLKSQADELRRSHAKELDDHRRIANLYKEEVEKLSNQLSAARVEIQDCHSKEVESTRRRNEQDENHQKTISLLVSEKTSLLASVARLEELEMKTQEKGELLQAERERSQSLDERVKDLESSSSKLDIQLQEALTRERDLAEKSRDQERELQLLNASMDEVRSTSEQHRQRVRELEEQIESDDRAERLEESLKNTQDRAEELEFQLSKLKQTLANAKQEKDEIQSQLQLRDNSETEWKAKHASLEEQHLSLQECIHSANQDRDALLEERASLQSQVNFNQSAIKQLQQKLGEVASELSSSDRALQNAHSDLRVANRRAEEAERTQKDLQTEGTRLMQSLDEMRPKFVELTSTKMDLMERIDKLEHEKNSRDTFISKLENALSEAMEREAEAAQVHKEADSLHEKDRVSLQQSIIELQQGYAELQAELESSQAAVFSLEGDRSQLRQTEARQLEIIDRLSMESDQHSQVMSRLESDLRSYRNLEEEHRAFIERSNYEHEVLRAELNAKDDEMEHLRTSSSDEAAPRSLDDEMIGALRVQHAMDLSNANSQIRTLETAVFEAQAKSHNLQKQISILEDQLAQQRSTSRATSRPFSPGVPGRPSSRAFNPTDLRRGSFSHRSSNLAPPSPRTVFDVGLSPETRHKRQVSLGMLKARIDSEVAASAGGYPSSRQLSPVPQGNEGISGREPDSPSWHAQHIHRRPQFMDESHIFWCHSCDGELVIL
jgi:myosin protein heavy chain